MANRLAGETSPYLLQHAGNPVDWYPWGDEALARARREDKPLLVSIGYSACHWCHVMERESFEDPVTAAYMNEHFVCVKVDREERPDVDAIYMEACQLMTGRAGWPLNVFLTPRQVPFFGGTYFPPESAHGLPSWRTVLESVVEAWRTRRFQIDLGAERVVDRLGAAARLKPAAEPPGRERLDEGLDGLRAVVDAEHGGFGAAPKFPLPSAVELLLEVGEAETAVRTLRAMAAGGIFDQVGGGFARYTVDAAWEVPHFEKMLYDNALLARAYLHGWLVSGDDLLRRVCCQTLEWALREMRGPEGGFCAALAAESGGSEGGFYVWTLDELRGVLGDDAPAAIAHFGATEEGNFEGANVLRRAGPEPAQLDRIRAALRAARERRPAPARDDKRLTAWNALMIGALAEAGAVLEHAGFLDAARACAGFVLERMRDADGRLLRSFSGGRAGLGAYLEDHAYLADALLTLYEATFEPRWFTAARELADTMIERFADRTNGGFFDTPADHERLLTRRKALADTPTPSGNATAAIALLRLAALTGEATYERHAAGVLRLMHGMPAGHPQVHASLLRALAFHLAPVREVALVGPDTSALERVVRSAHRPYLVLAGGAGDTVPLLEGRSAIDGRAAAYVCEHFACRRPVTDPDELAALLAG